MKLHQVDLSGIDSIELESDLVADSQLFRYFTTRRGQSAVRCLTQVLRRLISATAGEPNGTSCRNSVSERFSGTFWSSLLQPLSEALFQTAFGSCGYKCALVVRGMFWMANDICWVA